MPKGTAGKNREIRHLPARQEEDAPAAPLPHSLRLARLSPPFPGTTALQTAIPFLKFTN